MNNVILIIIFAVFGIVGIIGIWQLTKSIIFLIKLIAKPIDKQFKKYSEWYNNLTPEEQIVEELRRMNHMHFWDKFNHRF